MKTSITTRPCLVFPRVFWLKSMRSACAGSFGPSAADLPSARGRGACAAPRRPWPASRRGHAASRVGTALTLKSPLSASIKKTTLLPQKGVEQGRRPEQASKPVFVSTRSSARAGPARLPPRPAGPGSSCTPPTARWRGASSRGSTGRCPSNSSTLLLRSRSRRSPASGLRSCPGACTAWPPRSRRASAISVFKEGAGDAHVVVVGRADVHHQVGGRAQPVPAAEGRCAQCSRRRRSGSWRSPPAGSLPP